jgi:hypothetical protein
MTFASGATDLELLQVEIETLWAADERGRISGPDLVIGCSATGSAAAIGSAVPDELATGLAKAVAESVPPGDLSTPPPILEVCRQALEARLGPVALLPASGPSYFIPETAAFRSDVTLVRSNSPYMAPLRGANPGNWEAQEWQQLLDGQLGPWVMATHAGEVISICHTPRSSARAAEAGTWTRPDFRGQGHAAATTAAWASLMGPTGRHLFYSTSRTNLSSQRVAARLALRPIGWLWQLAGLRS